jgi:hypothetical protein
VLCIIISLHDHILLRIIKESIQNTYYDLHTNQVFTVLENFIIYRLNAKRKKFNGLEYDHSFLPEADTGNY